MSILDWLFPQFALRIPWKNNIAIIIAIVGTSVCVMGIALFRNAETTVNPSKPNQASALVVKGIYRLSRTFTFFIFNTINIFYLYE